MSPDEIKRALRQFRYDRYDHDGLRGNKRVPPKVLGDFVGLSRWLINRITLSGEMSPRVRAILSRSIIAIMEGKLHFRRYGQHWKAEGEAARWMYDDPRWRRRERDDRDIRPSTRSAAAGKRCLPIALVEPRK